MRNNGGLMQAIYQLPILKKISGPTMMSLLLLLSLMVVQMVYAAVLIDDAVWQENKILLAYIPLSLALLVVAFGVYISISVAKKMRMQAINAAVLVDVDCVLSKSLDENQQLIHILEKHIADLDDYHLDSAKENYRIRQSLDMFQTHILLLDANNCIDYINKPLETLLTQLEKNIQKSIPDFLVCNLLSSPVDVFNRFTEGGVFDVAAIQAPVTKKLKLLSYDFLISLSPVNDEAGIRMATVIEWQDVTEQLKKERFDKKACAFNHKIKTALDTCQTNVVLVDEKDNVSYMNLAVKSLIEQSEKDIQQDNPEFKADKVLGKNILEIFGKESAYENTAHAHNTDIEIGGHKINLYSTPVFDNNNKYLGTVLELQDNTDKIKLQQKTDVKNRENLLLSNAIDNVVGNVMLMNEDRKIIYTNKVLLNTLQKGQSDLIKEVPGFNVDQVLGMDAGLLHKKLANFNALIDGLTQRHEAAAMIGGRFMRLFITPIFDENTHKRLATVMEWKDDTLQVRMQDEIDTIVAAAANGDLSKRIDPSGKNAFYEKLSIGINSFLSLTEDFIVDVGNTITSMSQGDLRKPITTDYVGEFDRIKNIANANLLILSDVLNAISTLSLTVSGDAKEISQGNLDLSRRTEQQAASLEETAASMEQMTATIVQNTESSKNAAQLAGETAAIADEGGAVVSDAVTAMATISEASDKIADIITVIDEIAFQTNLLALNASVEAARAGEQGRGFAVVAGEVRNLAGRSATAAKEIKDLIEDSVKKVEEGKQLVNRSGESLVRIVDSAKQVSGLISEIATASEEQSLGIGEVNRAITTMDEMTQQNAALVEEVASTSEQMGRQTTELEDKISFFSIADMPSTGIPKAARNMQPVRENGDSYNASGRDEFVDSNNNEDEWTAF